MEVTYSKFEDQLEPDEQILWQGSPNLVANEDRDDKLISQVMWLFILAISVTVVVSSDWVSLYCFLWIGMVLIILCPSRGWLIGGCDHNINYLITNRRILSCKQWAPHPPKFETVAITQIEYTVYEKPEISAFFGIPSAGIGTVTVSEADNDPLKLRFINNVTEPAKLISIGQSGQANNLDSMFVSRLDRDPLRDALRQGETVLWQGQPERGMYNRLFWKHWDELDYYFLIGWLIGLAASDFARSDALWAQIAKILPIALIVLWCIGRDYVACVKNAQDLVYAVTDQRLIVLDRSKSFVFAEADLAKIRAIKFDALTARISTFSFGGKALDALSFEFVSNPSSVRAVITEAREKLSQEKIEWMNASDERAKLRKEIRGRRFAIAILLLIYLGPLSVFLPLAYFDIRYYNPAMRHFQRGEYAAATEGFRVASHATADEQIYYDLGVCLMHQKRYDEARSAFLETSRQALAEHKPDFETDSEAKAMLKQIDAMQAHPSSTTSPLR